MYMRNRIFFILLMLSIAWNNALGQQTATVKSFLETTDHIPSGDRRNDLNGVPCALVKVQVLDEIERVEGNKIGNIVNKGVEKWIYMCKGSRNVRLHFRNHLPLRVMFQEYNINGLESNRVYELVINVPQTSGPGVSAATKRGEFQMNVTPANATVTIWGDAMSPITYRPQDNGSLTVTLPYARYYFKVSANGYDSQEGNVFISDQSSFETITLQHSQQWLEEQRRIEEQKIAEQKRLEEERKAELKRQEEERKAEQRRIEEEKRQEELRQKAIADSIAQVRADSIAHERELKRQEEARIKAEQEAERARIKQMKHNSLVTKLERQDKLPFVFGIKAGYNMATSQFDSKYDGTTGSVGGFHFGVTADIRLANNFYLSSGLIYSGKGYTYENSGNDIDEEGNAQYIDIPLQASVRLPLGQTVKMFVNAGPYAAICVGGKVKDNWGNLEESFSTAYSGFDYGLQAGVGLILYHHIQIGADYQLGMGGSYRNRNLMLGVGYRF